MGIPEIWVIDPQGSAFCRYQDLQLVRTKSFVHAAKGIAFDMSEIRKLLE